MRDPTSTPSTQTHIHTAAVRTHIRKQGPTLSPFLLSFERRLDLAPNTNNPTLAHSAWLSFLEGTHFRRRPWHRRLPPFLHSLQACQPPAGRPRMRATATRSPTSLRRKQKWSFEKVMDTWREVQSESSEARIADGHGLGVARHALGCCRSSMHPWNDKLVVS